MTTVPPPPWDGPGVVCGIYFIKGKGVELSSEGGGGASILFPLCESIEQRDKVSNETNDGSTSARRCCCTDVATAPARVHIPWTGRFGIMLSVSLDFDCDTGFDFSCDIAFDFDLEVGDIYFEFDSIWHSMMTLTLILIVIVILILIVMWILIVILVLILVVVLISILIWKWVLIAILNCSF